MIVCIFRRKIVAGFSFSFFLSFEKTLVSVGGMEMQKAMLSQFSFLLALEKGMIQWKTRIQIIFPKPPHSECKIPQIYS